MTMANIPVLNYCDEKVQEKYCDTRPDHINSDIAAGNPIQPSKDQFDATSSFTESCPAAEICTDKLKFACSVKVHSQQHLFIDIDEGKCVSCIHNKQTKELRVEDKIIAINGKNVEDLQAENLPSILESCMLSGDGCRSMQFIMTVIRIENQRIQEIDIRFSLAMTLDNRRRDYSAQDNLYTRPIYWAKYADSTEDVVIKTEGRHEQQRFMAVKDGQIKMGIVGHGITKDECVFTIRKYKVCTRSKSNGMQKTKIAHTIWWKDMCFKGSEESGLRLEHSDPHAIPTDDALFVKRSKAKGSAFESVLYMYFYIQYNQSKEDVFFSQKRPEGKLGQTRHSAPDECRFKIASSDAFPKEEGSDKEDNDLKQARCVIL